MSDQTVVLPKRHSWHLPSYRGVSVLVAMGSAAGLVWFMWFRATWNPADGASEAFWLRIFVLFGFYAVIQQWTLAYETGRGDETYATADKFLALAPFFAVGACELIELGRYLGDQSVGKHILLSWRHHAVGGVWTIYAIVDFFATDITNQRLRALQFAPARPN